MGLLRSLVDPRAERVNFTPEPYTVQVLSIKASFGYISCGYLSLDIYRWSYIVSPASNHLHPLQVENCDSNSRLEVDEV